MASETVTRNDLKAVLKKFGYASSNMMVLYSKTSGIANDTTYTLNDSINNYDLIHITAISSYSNNWVMTIPTEELLNNPAKSYYTSLGTEFAVYNLSVKFPTATSMSITSLGSGTVGIKVVGIKLQSSGVVPSNLLHAETVTSTINMAYGNNVTVTAPTISGYKFLCWAHVITTGWLGCVNPEFPLQQTSPMWNATQGNSGTGQIDCLALYAPLRAPSADGSTSLATLKQTYTKSLSTSTWFGTTTFDITKEGYTPISVVASVNQIRYHCQVSDFTDTSATVQVADYSSTGMDVTVKLIVTYAMN